MTAGLPAIGLSGLFVLLTALVMPLVHVLTGRRMPFRVLLLALASITVAGLVWAGVRGVAFDGGASWPAVVLPAGLSLLLLAMVLGLPELLLRVLGTRRTPLPPPVVAAEPREARAPAEPQPV
jgi:hypothetical protein